MVDWTVALRADWLRVVYRYRKLRVLPDDLTSAEQRELYAGLCEVLMRLCKNLTSTLTGFISCDEAHNLLRQKDFLQRVERLITGDRKHGVECCRLSQRLQLLHTMVISQADRRVDFVISDDNHLAKINKVASFPRSA